jgi:hypothetical protein
MLNKYHILSCVGMNGVYKHAFYQQNNRMLRCRKRENDLCVRSKNGTVCHRTAEEKNHTQARNWDLNL